jgi:hypothetical protein
LKQDLKPKKKNYFLLQKGKYRVLASILAHHVDKVEKEKPTRG